jgi:phosphoglycolate phosphatase
MSLTVAFDLDGTLIDTPSAIVQTFAAVFAAMGETPPDAAATRATIGLPLPRAFGSLLGRSDDNARVTEAVGLYQTYFRELVLPRGRELIFPGVVDGLAALRAQGMSLAVATSKFHASAEALLRAAGLWGEFALVVGADEVSRPKPDPEMGLLIMQKLGAPADRTVVVGDTTHDLTMAKAAGARAIAVSYGVHAAADLRALGPVAVAETFDDVVTCLKELADVPQQRAAL